MNNHDIRLNILLIIENKKDLYNTCNMDSLSRLICSKQSFWFQKFDQHGLNHPKIIPNTILNWVLMFENEKIFNLLSDKMIEILNNPISNYFHVLCDRRFDHWPSAFELYISFNHIPFIDIFNIKEINFDDLLFLHNDYIMFKNNLKRGYIIPCAKISLINNIYRINIQSEPKNINVLVCKDTMKNIFYRISSHGCRLRDNYSHSELKC